MARRNVRMEDYGVLGEKAAFLAEQERARSASVNLWEFSYLAVVLAKTGEEKRASELLLRIAQQGRVRSDMDWFFQTLVSLPAPRSDDTMTSSQRKPGDFGRCTESSR